MDTLWVHKTLDQYLDHNSIISDACRNLKFLLIFIINSKYFFWERFSGYHKYLDLATMTCYTLRPLIVDFMFQIKKNLNY